MKMLSVDLPENCGGDIFEASCEIPTSIQIVVKSWYERISNPSFIAKQFELSDSVTKNGHHELVFGLHNLTMKPSLYVISDQETNDVELPFPEKDVEYIFVYGQCNGIFCLYGVYGGEKDGKASLILWNLGTKEVKVLPPSQNLPKDMVYIMYGFGIDPTMKDYKVVHFGNLDFEATELPPVEVYNLSTNSWRTIDVVVPTFCLCYPKCRAYLNGFNHWLTDDNDKVILFFDFSKEVFGKIQLPPGVDQSDELNVAVIDEKLACIATYTTNLKFEIWVMNNYGVESSWSKKYVFGPCLKFGSFLGNQEIKGFEIHGIPKNVQSVWLFRKLGSFEHLRIFHIESSTFIHLERKESIQEE